MEKAYPSKVIARICTLDGMMVGHIEELADSPYRVIIPNEPWQAVAQAITSNIESGKPLATRDNKLRVITGTTEEELEIVRHTIQILSVGNFA